MKCQCFSMRSRRKENEDGNLALLQQAGGILALVGGASPPAPTAGLPLWNVEVRGTRGFLGALEGGCPGRQVRTLLFWKLGDSCEPALEDFSNQSSEKLQSPPLHSRAVDHSLFELLEPGDISTLLQVPNALVVILLGDMVAIGLQRDLLILSV